MAKDMAGGELSIKGIADDVVIEIYYIRE